MKPTNKASRQLLLATLLAGSTAVASTGCSSGGFSMASMNPFSKSSATVQEPGSAPGMTESIAAKSTGPGATVRSVGTSAKEMFGKTTNAVTGVFRRDKPVGEDLAGSTDPLRLDNKPDKVDPEVFVANGQLWESTGDLTKAMESYTRALEQNPKHAPALTSLARLHFRQGNLPQAVSYFQRALTEKPQDAGLHNDLGLTLSKMGNQPAAVASLEKALKLAPGTSRYANNLASVRFEGGDPKAALTVLMQNNKPAVAHFNMAYLHFKKGQMPQAQGHLGEAMKFEPQAGGDAATGRAVQRSRDMLAQIQSVQGSGTPGSVPVPGAKPGFNANIAGIAKTAPQTAVAGGTIQGSPSYTAPVRQTSQAGTATAAVARAGSMGPAMAAITVPKTPATKPNPTATANEPATASEPIAKTASTATESKWNSWNRAVSGTDNGPAAIRPTQTTSKAVSEPKADTGIETAKPTNMFSLPNGFTLPSNK